MSETKAHVSTGLIQKGDLTQKVGLIVIGVSLVVIGLIISLLVFSNQQKRLKIMLADGRTLTGMVAAYAERELEDGVAEREQEVGKFLGIIDFLGAGNGWVYGMVTDPKGRVLAHSDSALVGTFLSDSLSQRALSSNNPLQQSYEDEITGNRIYEFTQPIFRQGEKTGVVRLGFSPSVNPIVSEGDIRVFSVVSILVFILVPIFYYLMRNSLRPIVSLNDELKSLLEHNEFKQVDVKGNRGVEELVERFNSAIASMRERYEELHRSHDEIEVQNRVLSYEKKRIEGMVENLGDGVLAASASGNVIFANGEMEKLMEISREKVLGKSLEDCFEEAALRELFNREQHRGDRFTRRSLELPLQRSRGEVWLRFSLVPVAVSGEKPQGVMLVVRDVTAQKMAEQNQSDFIAHVSHELRTPLTTIKSYVEMLTDDEVNDEETRRDFYNIINEEADRLARLIENLLNISKIEMGSLMLQKDRLKPLEFFGDIARSIDSQVVSKGVQFETVLPDKLSPLMVDKELLRVAILNLLTNAVKYTSSEGTVTFRAEEEDHQLKIEVSDTGYGISEEELPRIFDKFFRSADERIKAHTGNGLGLALCREIVHLHNGEIAVASRLGEGTRFTLHLPVEENTRVKGYEGGLSVLASR